MDRLEGENEALLKRLKDLEESGVRGSGQAPNVELVPRESYEAVNKEKQELSEELKRRDKRLLRLQEVCLALGRPISRPHLKYNAGLQGEERRVPGSDGVYPWSEALSKRAGARDVAIRPQRCVRVPTDGRG